MLLCVADSTTGRGDRQVQETSTIQCGKDWVKGLWKHMERYCAQEGLPRRRSCWNQILKGPGYIQERMIEAVIRRGLWGRFWGA